MITDESLKQMREHFEKTPELLSTPVPNLIVEMFKTPPTIPVNSAQTVTFTRPSLEDRIRWAKDHLSRTQKEYNEAQKDLEKLRMEKGNVS